MSGIAGSADEVLNRLKRLHIAMPHLKLLVIDGGAPARPEFLNAMMQGMIAISGDEWKLFEQHKRIGMITDNILHPFAHLTGGHAQHMDMANM